MLTPRNIKWDKAIDIVVVGYGMAGAVAAITAHGEGTSVMIVEKQNAESHCSPSSLSGGLFVSSTDVKGATDYLLALNRAGEGIGWSDPDSIRVLAEYSARNSDWIQNLGGKVVFLCKTAEHPQLPGAGSIELWEYRGKGLRMMQFMYQQVKTRKIDVQYQTAAERLLTDENGRVVGVSAIRQVGGRKRRMNIRAAKAVILCSGGFEANEEMKLQYLKVYPSYFTGGTANTGDGIKMAQEVGADLWHMNCVSARLVAKFDDFPASFAIGFGGKNWSRHQLLGIKEKAVAGYVLVDKYGRRYTSEDFKGHAVYYELTHFDTHRLEYPRVPSYYVFDQKRMEAGALCTGGISGPHQIYKWSQDNAAELRKGWIVSGRTVSELAGKIGVTASMLKETVQGWNRHCAAGHDAEFDRDPLGLIPLDTPPFYAVKLFPGGPNTQGGPRRNSRAQVMTPFGEPIPGLFAAGECGSVYGMLYPVAGGNLAECIAFGRIAAENAVQETSTV
ncbi:MAG: FAD-dependent oxidoreductase [Pseudomonadota bacterium]